MQGWPRRGMILQGQDTAGVRYPLVLHGLPAADASACLHGPLQGCLLCLAAACGSPVSGAGSLHCVPMQLQGILSCSWVDEIE